MWSVLKSKGGGITLGSPKKSWPLDVSYLVWISAGELYPRLKPKFVALQTLNFSYWPKSSKSRPTLYIHPS